MSEDGTVTTARTKVTTLSNWRVDRRAFLAASAATVGAQLMPHQAHSDEAAEPLTFACIGMGGQMLGYLVPELTKIDQKVVAICDVDRRQLERAARVEPLRDARQYVDYRVLLAEESDVDGIIIATPDHWHVPICQAAMAAGKHVYCEKPLAHSVAECHALIGLTQKYPELATQTGNQGCSTEGFRRSYEVIQAGVLGDITEVHVWHPAHSWPNGVDRPSVQDTVPEGFDWDFWLGAAPARPYREGIYHPAKWRGWYDFGGGSLADFCCHGFQLAFRALNLAAPVRVDVSGEDLGHESFPTRCHVRFQFDRGDAGPPVTLHFYSGADHLPPEEVRRGPVGTTGCLVVGSEGTLSAGLWNTDCNVRLKGESKFRGMDHPAIDSIPTTQPRIDTQVLKWDPRRAAKGQRPRWSRVNNSHMFEWVLACAGDTQSYSPFEIGARITEVGMLGVTALRLGKSIEWDATTRQVTNVADAARLLDPPARTQKYF